MQRNSTTYIVGFAAIVCVICSFFVSGAAVLLKDRQDANVLLNKQQKVLQVSGLIEATEKPTAEEVREIFGARIDIGLIDLEADAMASDDVDIDPATYDQLAASKDPALSMTVDKNTASVARIPKYSVVYKVYKDDAKTDLDLVVLPVEGLGLWGTLYGYLALDRDGDTIRGLIFHTHKETPGLGAEVDNPNWKKLWPGRKAYDEEGMPQIEVIKGVAGSVEENPYQVDGLSGATITSKGVTNLLRFWLGEDGYGKFISDLREEGSEA